MSLNPVSCEDCSFPPNFIVLELKDKVNTPYYSIKCRDCGDCWDEPNENFCTTPSNAVTVATTGMNRVKIFLKIQRPPLATEIFLRTMTNSLRLYLEFSRLFAELK